MPSRPHIVSLLAALAALSAGCSLGDGSVGASEPRDVRKPIVARIVVSEVPTSIDPARVNPLSAVDVALANLLFDGLTTIVDGRVEGSVAADWATTDGRAWTFDLDDFAEFSDGRRIDAEAVSASLTRAKEADDSIPALSLSEVMEIIPVDDATVAVTMKEANWELPKVLASPALGIVPPDFESGEPVSSGPFEVLSMGDTGWRLDGVGPGAAADEVRFDVVNSDRLAVDEVQAGDAEMAIVEGSGLPIPEDMKAHVFASLTVYLGVRQGAAQFGDAAERERLMGVVDRGALADELDGALAAQALTPLESVGDTCDAGCDPMADDTTEALDPLVLDYLDTDIMARIAGAVAIHASRTGVEIEAKGRSPDEMEAAIIDPTESAVLFGVAGLSESPDSYLTAAFASSGKLNVLGLTSNTIDEALTAARGTKDDVSRAEAFREVEALVIGRHWAVPLVRTGKTVLTSASSPLGTGDLFGSQILNASR